MLVIYFGAAKNSTEYKIGHVNGMSCIVTPFCLLFHVDKLYQSADGRFRSTLKALSIIRNKRCHSKDLVCSDLMAEMYEMQEAMWQKNGIPLSVIWWWIILMFGVYIHNYSETCFRSPCSRSVPTWGIRTFQHQNFLVTLHYPVIYFLLIGFPA